MARNAQVINAMGMLPESIQQWGAQQARTLTVQGEALDRNFWISGVAKFVRLSRRSSSSAGARISRWPAS